MSDRTGISLALLLFVYLWYKHRFEDLRYQRSRHEFREKGEMYTSELSFPSSNELQFGYLKTSFVCFLFFGQSTNYLCYTLIHASPFVARFCRLLSFSYGALQSQVYLSQRYWIYARLIYILVVLTRL